MYVCGNVAGSVVVDDLIFGGVGHSGSGASGGSSSGGRGDDSTIA